MPKRSLASLGMLVREQRGARKLREVAAEIGISAATLLRVEAGRIPDVVTFGKLCQWLKLDPSSFLGMDTVEKNDPVGGGLIQMSAHFKTDKTAHPETIKALAQMLLYASNPLIEEPKR